MKKKLIVSIICLFAIVGLISFGYVNSSKSVSEQKTTVSKQNTNVSTKITTDTSKVKNKAETSKNSTNTSKKSETKEASKAETKTNTSSKTSSSNKNTANSKTTTSKNVETTKVSDSVKEESKSFSKQETVVESEPQQTVQEPVVESTPVPVEPTYACPGGVNQNVACDAILDSNYYYATFSSESEACSSGEYYMNDVMYIDEIEITNYSVQPVYRNDHIIAYYGLNLWSNGSLIQ